jgi:hypothetical protein
MAAYIVFYARNARIGSTELTPENLAEAHRLMILSHIQTDVTGTQHYACVAVR